MLAVAVVLPLFVTVKDGMFPLPVAASPIEGLSFVQLYVVPLVVPIKFIGALGSPLQRNWFMGCIKLANGRTVMRNDFEVPGQLLNSGETVIVAVTGEMPLFTPLKAGISPFPFAGKPMEV